MRLGKLRDPWWDDRVDKTNADTGDDSGTNEHIGIRAARHQRGAHDGEEGTDPDTLLATKLVTGPT